MASYSSFAVSVIGGDHVKHGKDREDAAACYDDTGISIAVIADGHGEESCFRSRKGADIAVACATRGIQDFIKNHETDFKSTLFKKAIPPSPKEFEKYLRNNLMQYTIASWHRLVADDYEKNPFTKEELEKVSEKYRKRFEAKEGLYKAYGATLIAAVITPHYWFGMHIGDGRFTALYPDGSFDQPVPWDDKCYLNVTTSICDDDAFERARYYFSFIDETDKSKLLPAAVFLCSDGIDDNYPVSGNDEHLFKLYRTIAITFAEEGFESTAKQLEDLANQFATKGKGDDTSIAGFIDMEVLKQAAPIWKKQVAVEEAAAKKAAAKKAAEKAAAEKAEAEAAAKAEAEKAAAEAEADTETEAPKEIASKMAQDAIEAYKKNQGTSQGNPTEYGDFLNSADGEIPTK